jgi:NAD(P)-dependent dehydrogenase (short-subunit alcohol dehydrogenase family)
MSARAPEPAEPTALTGANVVLTGATSPGIGAALLEGLLAGGAAKIFMLARTVSKAEAAAAKYGAGDRIEVVKADLSKLADVEKASLEIAAKGVPINIVMLNAATMNSTGGASPPGKTAEGLEESFAVNVAAPHLMARLLVPALAPNARIIVTGSDAGSLVKWKMDFENLEGAKGMGNGGLTQYGRTKLALHMEFAVLAARLGERANVAVFHPGAVLTSLGNNVSPTAAAVAKFFLRAFFRTPRQGAIYGLHAATAATPVRGYLEHGNFGRPSDFALKVLPGATDEEANERLWKETESRVCKALGRDALPPV